MNQVIKTTFEFGASPSVLAAAAEGRDAGYAVKLFRASAEDGVIQHLPPDATTVTIEAPEGQHVIVLVAARVEKTYSKAEPFEFTSKRECLPLGPGRLEMKHVQVPVSLPVAPPEHVVDANKAITTDMVMVNGHPDIIDGSEGTVSGRTPDGDLVAIFDPSCIRGTETHAYPDHEAIKVIARNFEGALVAIAGSPEITTVERYLEQHGNRLIVITLPEPAVAGV